MDLARFHQGIGEQRFERLVAVNLAADIPSIYCDRNQITQVFINLLTNARDALPKRGGKIWIKSHYDPEKRRNMVMVTDNGSGIEPIILDRIFEPFFTTKAPGKGTGLGLAIASQIVAQHQGDISVETNVSAGTTFTVELPVEKRDREQPASF